MSLTEAYVTSKDHSQRNENEYYPTPAIATLSLLKNHPVPKKIWEPAAGRGHISRELIRNGHEVVSSDLYKYEDSFVEIETDQDFLTCEIPKVDGLVTNPPFKSNLPERLLKRILPGPSIPFVALFTRLTFMESARRYDLFKEYPPSRVLVFSERIQCNEIYFDKNHGLGGMVAYCWMIWDYDYYGDKSTSLNWIKPSNYIKELE